MKKLTTAILAAVMSAASLSAFDPQQIFRSRADVVTIQASVRKGGRIVSNLGASDFELIDNGVVQKITAVAAERVPLDVTMLLDLSISVDGQLLQRLKTAIADTQKLLRAEDRIRMVVVSQVLQEVVPFQPGDQPVAVDALKAEGATSLYDGLAAALMRPTAIDRRQVILAFTDGRDSTSIVDGATLKDISRLTDSTLHFVVPLIKPGSEQKMDATIMQRDGMSNTLTQVGGNMVTGSNRELEARAAALKPWALLSSVPSVLNEFVDQTGGQVFPVESGESISAVFKRVLEDVRTGYQLQYQPTGVSLSGWHDVTVRVTQSGKFDVRARKGYGGGTE